MSDEYTGNADSSATEVTETVPDVQETVDTSAGDVEYLDMGMDSTISEDETVQEQPASVEESPAKEDPQRMAYWQSKADTAMNEVETLRREMEQLKTDSFRNEQRNEQSFSSGYETGSPEGNLPNSLKEPTPPQRPANYNEVDAYNDPDSEAFKYRMAKEQYQDDMITHLQKADAQRNEIFQAQMMRQEQQAVVRQAYDHVRNSYGWDNDKATKFVSWARDPNNVDMDILAKVYEASHAPNPEQVRISDKAEQMRAQQERLRVPRTTTVESGESPPKLSEGDVFNAGLLAHRR